MLIIVFVLYGNAVLALNCAFIVNCVTLCYILRIMHCVSLAILSQLSRSVSPSRSWHKLTYPVLTGR